MRLVLDLYDEVYNNMVVKNEYTEMDVIAVHNALMGAILIPEGHGRLGDLDALAEFFRNARRRLIASDYATGIEFHIHDNMLLNAEQFTRLAPTIIEADKEYEVEVVTRGNCMMCGKELTEGLFFCKECEDKGRMGNELDTMQ